MNKKTRIAWVLIPLGVGGGALTVLQTWAANIDLGRFEISVIVGIDGDSKAMRALDLEPLPIYTVPTLASKRGWLLPALTSVIRILRAEKFDIVHTMLIQSDVLGTIAAKLVGSSIVVSSVVGYPYRAKTPRVKKWIYRCFYRIVHPFLDRIVAVSHKTRTDLISDFGVTPAKVDVVYLGLDERFLKDCEHVPPPNFSKLVIGTMAELITEKGVGDFIDAAMTILRQVPTARFVIAGDGPERANLTRKVEAYGISDMVQFQGWVTSCVDWLRSVTLFVLPSYEEGLPWSLLEAMACRRPAVATDVGGIPEIISHGQTGLLVSPGQPESIAKAVLRMVHDPEWALQIGKRGGNEVAARFTSRMEVSAMEALYDEAKALLDMKSTR